MKKIIFLYISVCLLSTSLWAQKRYPYVLGYTAGESVSHKGTGVSDTFDISFSGGAPFATQWEDGLNSNKVLCGFRHNIIYVDQAFESDLFVSKGYYGDHVELKWDLDKYINQVTAFKVYRKVLGESGDSVQVASVSADARRYQDEYAESGVIYKYTLVAEGLFPFYEKYVNYVDGIGFRVPYGRISGRITYKGGAAVPGVSVIAESDDEFGGYSVSMDGSQSYMVISPTSDDEKFELDTAFTFQAWLNPSSTALSSVFKKGSQYQITHETGKIHFTAGGTTLDLDFAEKADTFFHVSAVRSPDSLRLVVKYSDTEYFVKSVAFAGTTTKNTDEIFLGKNGSTQYYKGEIDEIRIWHKSFELEDILTFSGMYISGTEEGLTAYYRLNENVGSNFYDLSRKGFSFYENHGYLYKTSWSSSIPKSTQLAVKGITDANGNYIISGIPYSTDGTIYRFIPVYDIHTFDPTEQLLFLGPGSTTHNNVDFIDVASFPVRGTVFYRNTNFPVSGVNIKIDGVTAVNTEGVPITSDAVGFFEIDVPIGKHYITLEKYGHGLVNEGRFPATEGEFFDFQAPYTFQTPFLDTTLIKVIGRVVGGPVEGEKPVGLGLSKANIDQATIVLGTQKEYDLTDDASGSSGIWENEMYHEDELTDKGDTEYEIKALAPKQIEIKTDPSTGEYFAYLLPEKYVVKSVTAGSYTFDPSFHTTLDLTQSYLYHKEEDTTSVLGIDGDIVLEYDSVSYQKKHNYIYRVSPEVDVVNRNTKLAPFWESSVTAKDGNTISIIDVNGDPLTDFPVIKQRNRYALDISLFEKYTNQTTGIEDRVPVTDGVVEVQNGLAIKQSKQTIKVDQYGIAQYDFVGGLPNTTQGGIGDYLKTMAIVAYTGKNGAIVTPWLFNGETFKAYVLGGLPTGNNFVTTGPNQVDMILRDPFGSTSYAWYEVGQSVATTKTYSIENGNAGTEDLTFHLGASVKTFAGVGAGVIVETEYKGDLGVGIDHSETWLNDSTTVTTVTSTKKWQTSAETDYVGAAGDVFIGHSTNIVYGEAINLTFIPSCEVDDYCTDGSDVSGYKIGKNSSIRVNPEFNTAFMYTQNHIENYLIPNLEKLRNNVLKNSSYFTSNLPVSDANYGSNNSTGTNDSYTMNVPASWPDDSLFTDSIHFYNEQIKNWKLLLARNEREKAEAILETNHSFDAGVVYESSITIDTATTEENSFEWTISPYIAGKYGASFNKFGMTASFKEAYTHKETETDGTETTSSVTFGYQLSDGDQGDYFSVDIKKPKTATGPVFSLKGGQSQCPYEGAVISKYYSPGTILSEATQQREKPTIAVTQPIAAGIPEDQKAIFEISLGNITPTNSDVWFVLAVDENSNQNGAKISMDGAPIGNGRLIRIPAGTSVNKILSLEKVQPDVFDYENIRMVLHSACQYDPTDNVMDIADSVSITARFQPVCTPVNMSSPVDQWVINTNTGTDLGIEISDYNLAHSTFENVKFQYKPNSTSQWITDMVFYVDQTAFDAAQDPKTNIDGSASMSYVWETEDLKDRIYDVRLLTECADGTTNESVTATGIRDIKRPEVFGTPQPADGILSPSDDIMISFDETIQAGLLLSSNFSVRGVLNGSEIQHTSCLYFDGIDDYASVINGVNLTNSSATVEFWVRRASLNAGTLLSIGEEIEIGFNANNNFVTTLNGITVNTTSTYTATDEWIHFAVAYDHATTSVNIYANDQWLVENANVSSVTSWSDQIRVGSSMDGSNASEFFMHDLRIWDRARGFGTTYANMSILPSGAEIGLVGLWAMDEASGAYAPDKARNQNALLRGPQWKVFPIGYARTFDGVDDAISIPTASSVIITDEMDYTIELWYKGNNQVNSVLFSNGRGDNTDATPPLESIVVIGTNANGSLYVQNNGNTLTVNDDYLDNEWHHFAFVVNRRANASIYIDGELKTFTQSDDFGGLYGAAMSIGCRMQYQGGSYVYDRYFSGSIDEVRIWELARTASLLNLDMNAKLSGDEVGLVAYYPFDSYDINLILQPTLEDEVEKSSLSATAIDGAFDNNDVPNIKDARPVQNLAFDWVVNDDQLIINILEQPQLIEKTVIEFTVKNIEDLQENRMASPVTWTAYIKKNTMVWDADYINLEKELYEPMTFDVDINNIGGVEQNYTIKNLPSWITPSSESGTLLPDSRKTITFEVDPSVNIGEYDLSVFLGSDFGYNEKLELNIKVSEQAPEWIVDESDYQYSMSVIGYVKLDNVISTNADDKVAAFVNDECRGVANLEYIEDYDRYEVFLTVYSNAEQGEDVTFKIWNASEGIEHINVTPELVFEANALYGSPADPLLLESSNSYSSKLYLGAGWKWISFNLNDPNLNNINALLVDIEAEQGDQIKGQTSYANYDPFIGWNGSLNTSGMNVEKMYLVKLGSADTIEFSGSKVDVSTTPIAIATGWNWIGFTPQGNITLNRAMGNYDPADGDIFKSQYAFAVYDQILGWIGNLDFLKPGEGYMFKTANPPADLLYPINGMSSLKMAEKASSSPWVVNDSSYAFNMSIIASINGISSEDYAVGVFVGDECRGYAEPKTYEVDGRNQVYYFLTTYGVNTEELSFKLFHIADEKVIDVNEILEFVTNGTEGTTSNPYLLGNGIVLHTSDDNPSSTLDAYPSPFVNELNVIISDDVHTDVKFEVLDITGRVLYTENISSLSSIIHWSGQTSSGKLVSTGMYTIKVTYNGVSKSLSVIKE